MANKSLFASLRGRFVPAATARNAEGAPAYALEAEAKLAQIAMTGTFGGLFYLSAEAELEQAVQAAEAVEPAFLARAAIHARAEGYMKDMPAALLAVLARRDPVLFRRVFGRVVDDGKMLRVFVQVMRSGRTGRKSLGSAPKAKVAEWLNAASDRTLLFANIGADPSLADVIRMVHPKPASAARAALYAWIIGKPAEVALLPQALQDWLAFKETGKGPVPDVPFQMLTQLELTAAQWAGIARGASWQTARQGLNMFLRHGVFTDPAAVRDMAAKLRDPERIRRAKAFPYQLMATALNVAPGMPGPIREALTDAMEISVSAVPVVKGQVVVAPDVSGSMTWPVTGHGRGKASVIRHVDVAALIAAAMLRRNPSASVMPFDWDVREAALDRTGTILGNAEVLAKMAGGGTNVSAPLARLNAMRAKPDLVVIVSDNQSWVDALRGGRGTGVMREWTALKRRAPRARLVLLDIAPYATTQAPTGPDVLNVGGFSDAAFRRIADFASGQDGAERWAAQIAATEI